MRRMGNCSFHYIRWKGWLYKHMGGGADDSDILRRRDGGLCKHEKEGQLALPSKKNGGRAMEAREGGAIAPSIREDGNGLYTSIRGRPTAFAIL